MKNKIGEENKTAEDKLKEENNEVQNIENVTQVGGKFDETNAESNDGFKDDDYYLDGFDFDDYDDAPPPEEPDFEDYDKLMDEISSGETKAKPVSTSKIFQIDKSWQNNPRRLWGRLVMMLREENYMALHTACGEIRDIVFEGDTLKATVKEKFLYNILVDSENYKRISLELSKIDDKIKLEFELKKVEESVFEKNMNILKDLFGDEIEYN